VGNTETCNDRIQSEMVSALGAALSNFVRQGMHGRMQVAAATSSRIGLPLSAAALTLLDALSAKPMRPTELAAFVGIKPSSLTQQIQELEAKGLGDRATDEQDRRAAVMRLTQAGQDSLADAAEILGLILSQVTKGWSVEQIEEVIELLDRLSEGVRAGWKDFSVSRAQNRVMLEGDAEVIAKNDDN